MRSATAGGEEPYATGSTRLPAPDSRARTMKLTEKSMSSLRLSRQLIAWFALVAVAASGCGIHESIQRARQIRTQATLQDISAVARKLETHQRARAECDQIMSIASREAEVTDGWDNTILCFICSGSNDGAVLLVSRGADGALDVGSLSDYCGVESRESVEGEFDSDIVFRNGRPLKSGGK